LTPVKTLHLIDGTAQLFRAYFAIPGLTDESGMPTNAIYGFTTMLRKLLKEERPTHAAAAFDLGGDVFRHATFADYKANRPPVPDGLDVQVPFAKQVCEALGVRVLERAGYEADDVIATYTARARAAGWDVVVIAADKDLLQLVGPGVSLLNPTKNLRFDAEGVKTEFGVPPDRVRDVLGLMGDSVDNIPGVPGVGEKTALAVVSAHGDLERVLVRAERTVALFEARDALIDSLDPERQARFLAAAEAFLETDAGDELASRVRTLVPLVAEADLASAKGAREVKRELKGLDRGSSRRIWSSIHEHREDARLSRELATLHADVPVEVPVDALTLEQADMGAANALFSRLGFRSLVLEEPVSGAPGGPICAPDVAVEVAGTYEHITDDEGLARLRPSLAAARRIAIVVGAKGDDRLAAEIGGIGLAWAEGRAAWVDAHLARRGLEDVLAGRVARTLVFDAKRAAMLLLRHHLPVDDRALDVMVGAFLLDPGRSDYTLERLSTEIGGLAPPRPTLGALEPARADVAAAEEADRVLRIGQRIEPRLEQAGLASLYEKIDGPLLPVLARMELHGIRIDVDRLGAMAVEMEAQIRTEREAIWALAEREFNVDSPKQLREVLFDQLGLATRRKTEKGKLASTDAQTLEELADEHAIVRHVLDYRELAKLKGTYVDALPRLVRPETGRVHTTFDPTGAATGRLSSFDPNLQNIPVRSAVGRRIRDAFVPEPGYVFLASDYSQIELRVLAHLSHDEELFAAFRAGEDVHRYTAARVFGVAPDLVTDAMRRRAKAVNFGILYGMSETRLAREQGMSRPDARRFIEAYFTRFASVRRYIDQTREQARRDGFVRTAFGRIRHFPRLHVRAGRAEEEQALRAAVNTTIQGTAADLMKLAMLAVDDELARAGGRTRMLLQVHDELLLEVPADEVETMGGIVRQAMERVADLAVPLLVDQKVGSSWLLGG
jgi:DNA polymerase-1